MRESAVLEVDLAKIKANTDYIRNLIPLSTKIMLVIKADAYGLGAIEIARYTEDIGISYFGVVTIEEGAELRNAGIEKPILILSEVGKDDVEKIVDLDLTATVYSKEFIELLAEKAKYHKKPVKVHLKVDTGLTRLGCFSDQVENLIDIIQKQPFLELEGIYTHFAQAEEKESDFTNIQIRRFKQILDGVGKNKINIPIKHMANSAAVQYFPESHKDMVRVGLLAYKDIFQFKSKIMYLKKAKKGAAVGYGGEYITDRDEVIGIVGIGYADGFPTSLNGKGFVLIRNKKFPVVGKICMDMFMVSLGNNEVSAKVGDEVVLVGEQGDEKITLNEVCQLSGFNPREFTCGIGNRVKKTYI